MTTWRPAAGLALDAVALVPVLVPLLAVALGAWVYRDARRRGHDEYAPWAGLAVAGLLVTGSVPGLVALAVAPDAAVEGFPTALRVVPGLVALAVYLTFR